MADVEYVNETAEPTGDAMDSAPNEAAGDSLKGLTTAEAKRRLAQYGPNALEEEERSLWRQIAGYFWGPIPWMIEIAGLLSIAVGDWGDFLMIMSLLLFNAGIDFWNEYKATNALDALKDQLALKARALRDGLWREIEAKDLVPGDVVRLRLGDVIPADATLAEGEYLSVDQAALTGESLPVSKKVGDEAYSGSIVKQGEMVAEVTKTGANTFFGRTAKLVSSAGNVSHFQHTIMTTGNFLIVTAVALSIVLTCVQLARGDDFLDLLQFVLLLVIASIPVAMPAVLSVTMSLGALTLSKEKAIVSKLQAIEEMACVDILCSDKTGTLTKNQLTLGDPVLFEAKDAQQCILAGALASKEEDNDAIDLAVIGGLADPSAMRSYEQTSFTPFDPVRKRTEGAARRPDGTTALYTKGAPQVVLDLCGPSEADVDRAHETIAEMATKGYRTLGVAQSTDDGANWRFLGILPLFDPPRDDSSATIKAAKEYGLQVKMVTGDDTAIGAEISGRLGLGTHLLPASDVFEDDVDPDNVPDDLAKRIEKADGFARVFPEHKYAIVKSLQEHEHYVGMTGDGVNDAPALKQADVGIAVSGATDAARAAADLILTAPGLSAVVRAIQTARQIFERMVGYTVYRIAMTIDVMFFVVLATLVYQFRPLTAMMIVMLALLDDVPVMMIAYDNASIEKRPSRWRMKALLSISTGLGLLSVAETFGLLVIALGIMDHPGWGQWFQATMGTTMDTSHIQSMVFLQLIAGGHLLLFLTRTKGPFFKPPYPSWQLTSAIVGTQLFAVALCGFGLIVPQLPWTLIGIVYVYNFAWMFFLDFCKMAMVELFKTGPRQEHHQKFLARVNSKLHSHVR